MFNTDMVKSDPTMYRTLDLFLLVIIMLIKIFPSNFCVCPFNCPLVVFKVKLHYLLKIYNEPRSFCPPKITLESKQDVLIFFCLVYCLCHVIYPQLVRKLYLFRIFIIQMEDLVFGICFKLERLIW